MARIGIFGMGNWGTALAKVWSDDGHTVTGWTIENEVYESLMIESTNHKYLPGVKMPNLQATMAHRDILDGSEILVFALPSSVILDVIDLVLPDLKPSHVILDLAKGLAPEEASEDGMISTAIEHKLRSQGKSNPVLVLTGPTIAPEVARGVVTSALVACDDDSVAKKIAQRLSTKTLILSSADDPVGAELWGAYKNTVALACGIVDGLRDSIGGDNLKAALVQSGFNEGRALLSKMGASTDTAFGPAGLGDLYVTSTSPRSRNRTLGEKLGQGKSLQDALDEMTMVAEGVRATRMFNQTAMRNGWNTPFLNSLCDLLDGKITPDESVRKMVESF
ncbi:MAG: NAD(P)H-dependent glycerol-3-phosphate dehydrogenase [Euryarchaeota archaeon]|nr:NAD(P)H-dependent glycerol-3-phosphate dehydrogenase [Euryarchaeota archaeon]NDB93037.1 NAD(P)H-dependent glycerol-3-phosphate dehydrogenase [Euryarchaeota archaeon]NDF21808.1 NAD(P)H-dependent glycerol-3-phosphate dehydrogenase [Euryarchaeota archaeon]NDF36245.1 NAD(P)H-dependent glycerol-3-phosphate dehydrogenase [Euryarchaeota archaeon]NDG21108.1 NAD(P)H-dependent glycerol-3-phosphate dehydrogenase [Euryarchaeota archaeon]